MWLIDDSDAIVPLSRELLSSTFYCELIVGRQRNSVTSRNSEFPLRFLQLLRALWMSNAVGWRSTTLRPLPALGPGVGEEDQAVKQLGVPGVAFSTAASQLLREFHPPLNIVIQPSPARVSGRLRKIYSRLSRSGGETSDSGEQFIWTRPSKRLLVL